MVNDYFQAALNFILNPKKSNKGYSLTFVPNAARIFTHDHTATGTYEDCTTNTTQRLSDMPCGSLETTPSTNQLKLKINKNTQPSLLFSAFSLQGENAEQPLNKSFTETQHQSQENLIKTKHSACTPSGQTKI